MLTHEDSYTYSGSLALASFCVRLPSDSLAKVVEIFVEGDTYHLASSCLPPSSSLTVAFGAAWGRCLAFIAANGLHHEGDL